MPRSNSFHFRTLMLSLHAKVVHVCVIAQVLDTQSTSAATSVSSKTAIRADAIIVMLYTCTHKIREMFAFE